MIRNPGGATDGRVTSIVARRAGTRPAADGRRDEVARADEVVVEHEDLRPEPARGRRP